jgi:predicted ribosome quality control (RQC) complex YloA/Tae2 family protein
MRGLLVKDLRSDSDLEANITTSTPSGQENAQKLKSPGEAKQLDYLQGVKKMDNSDILQLLESFQKMRAEEQRLVELKQKILAKQYDLQNALAKEMEKMKAKIANLASEIPELENKTHKLGEALGMDNYSEDQLPKMDSPSPITKEVLPDCVGLINCAKPEKCLNYDSCLKNYVAAEIRNEIPRL